MFKLILTFLAITTLAGCSSAPSFSTSSAKQQGKASYYADKYHGRLTASGEVYSQQGMTAAHKELPFGSKVRVTNLTNNRSIIVKINDRGPFIRGRIIDLTKHAFSQLANLNEGVVDVEIELLNAN
ncbi:MAG: septal ring lytic transglycosylase RlpA family protein [Pseudoalteromonas sp.]